MKKVTIHNRYGKVHFYTVERYQVLKDDLQYFNTKFPTILHSFTIEPCTIPLRLIPDYFKLKTGITMGENPRTIYIDKIKSGIFSK